MATRHNSDTPRASEPTQKRQEAYERLIAFARNQAGGTEGGSLEQLVRQLGADLEEPDNGRIDDYRHGRR